jgi:hypothetical protein
MADTEVDFFAADDAVDENSADFIRNRITNYVKDVRDIDRRIAELDDQMKLLKGQKDELELKKIPDALLEAGMLKITTLEGLEVTTKLSVGAIPKENKAAAFDWMDKHGFSSLIKRQVAVSFDKGSSEAAEKAVLAIQALGLEPKQTLDVHHQTWAAFAKEQTNKGVQIPFDAWGVWVGNRATIKG